MTRSYFTRLSENTFAPTEFSDGAWSAEDYHFAALAGLITHVIEQHRLERDGGRLDLSRISFDILGRLPFAEVDIAVEIKRPGRTIELVEAVATIGDRVVIVARAWYLLPTDTSAEAGVEYDHMPAPENCPERDLTERWGGGFMRQLEARQARAVEGGRSATWLTSPNKLVAGEDPIRVAEFVTRIDAANGLSPRREPTEWAFPNVDLTIHLFRQPVGDWTGLDTATSWGPSGIGLTASTLHDVHGPVGRAEQSLTLRKV